MAAAAAAAAADSDDDGDGGTEAEGASDEEPTEDEGVVVPARGAKGAKQPAAKRAKAAARGDEDEDE
jgi:hypothetical protein